MRLKISFASLSLDNKKRKTRYEINHFIYFSLATTSSTLQICVIFLKNYLLDRQYLKWMISKSLLTL